MSYHTLVYNLAAAGVNAANTDMLAAVDSEFSQRSSHYVFTESYRLLAASYIAPSATRARFQVPHWNAIAEFTIMNANRSLQPPSNPQWDVYREMMLPIPQLEEFQVQASNNLGAATEQANVVLNIAPDDWKMQQSPSQFKFVARATLALTPTLNAWSGPQAITMSQSLRGGTYAILGTVVQGTNAVAWRWVFPRNKLYNNRRLRPGGLTQNAVGDVVNNQLDPWGVPFGVLGYFNTFELPSIELFGTLAGAITYQIFIWLAYLGEDQNLLNQALAGSL